MFILRSVSKTLKSGIFNQRRILIPIFLNSRGFFLARQRVAFCLNSSTSPITFFFSVGNPILCSLSFSCMIQSGEGAGGKKKEEEETVNQSAPSHAPRVKTVHGSGMIVKKGNANSD